MTRPTNDAGWWSRWWLHGLRLRLIAWRVGGLLTVALQGLTLRWDRLWGRQREPGVLVVSTSRWELEEILAPVLEAQKRRWRVCRAKEVTQPGDEGTRGEGRLRSIPDPWHVTVRGGTERAVLRAIEYEVSVALAHQYRYADASPQRIVAVGRSLFAVERAHRMRPNLLFVPAAPGGPPGQVAFVDHVTHTGYVERITRQVAGEPRPVGVAILDSLIHADHLPGDMHPVDIDSDMNRPPMEVWAHGEMLCSVIGTIAPNARITLYPVMTRDYVIDQRALTIAAKAIEKRADSDLPIEVVVLAFGIEHPTGEDAWLDTRTTDDLMKDLADGRVVLASTGNGRTGATAMMPGSCGSVLAVGATTLSGTEAASSRRQFPDGRLPALHLLAPGGDAGMNPPEYSVTVAAQPQVGTSVAVAYAGAVVARMLGWATAGLPRSLILQALEDAALAHERDPSDASAPTIHEPEPGWVGRARLPSPDRPTTDPATASAPSKAVDARVGLAPIDADLRDRALDLDQHLVG